MIRRKKDGKEFFVFSCHAHMGVGSMLEIYSGKGRTFLGEQMISNINHFGVDATVAFSTVAVHTDYSENTDHILEAASEYPDRIVPFARINPHFEKAAVDSISKYVKRGIRGLKFHPFWDAFAINDPVLVRPIMEEANRYGLTVLFHTGEAWTTLPGLVWDLALDYKNVKFIIGHSGQYGFDTEAWAVVKRSENIWLDTSELWSPQRVRTMVNMVGKERVLFGTDAPYINSAAELEKVLRFSNLTDDELEAILGWNLAKMLDFKPDLKQYRKNVVDYPHEDPIFWA